MIKHIVFWNFSESAEGRSKAENMDLVEQKLLALKDLIPELLEIEVGRDFNGSPAAFDMALYTTFAGLVCSILAGVQYQMLDRGADDLIETAKHLSSVYVLPKLRHTS